MSTRLATALFVVLVATLLLLPLLMVRYPPLLDYPDHLARSFIVAHLNDPAYRFRDLYFTEWGPYPYLGMDLTLIALQQLMPAETAGRVFLSMCVLGLPMAGWWFLRQANPGHGWLAVWLLLISYGLFFLEGFANFQFASALSLLALATWLRYLHRPNRVRLALMFVLFTAVYFSHLIVFGLTGFIVLVYSLAERLDWHCRLWSWSALAPGVLLYWRSHISAYNGREVHFRSLPHKFFAARAALLHSYSPRQETIFFWVIMACVLISGLRNREFRWNRSWVIVAIAVCGLYLLLPVSLGQTWAIDVRLVPAIFVLMLTIARLGRRQKTIAAIAVFICGARMIDITRNFVLLQHELEPMATAIQMLPRNARLLPVIDVDRSQDVLHRLYTHFWAYAIVERGALAPYIFDLRGQTEVRIHEDSWYIPDAPEEFPPDWDQVRRYYDHVWIWDADYSRQLQGRTIEVYHAGPLHLYRIARSAGVKSP